MIGAVIALSALQTPWSVLVFSRTTGFRHDSIPAGVAAIQELGKEGGFSVVASEDPSVFTDSGLKGYRAVVFLNTTGDILNNDQQAAMERFVAQGGGFAGVHSAADTEYGWSFYGKLVGAYFKSHPHIQPADVLVKDRKHLSTQHLEAVWKRTDEWYCYQSHPAAHVKVLCELDQKSYQGSTMADPHPIAWHHDSLGGRAWYTGGGHTKESYAEPAFRRHLLGGILYVAKRESQMPKL